MRIDLRRWPRPREWGRYHVLLDGEDVSADCFLADDAEGVVGLYLKDADGRHCREGGGAAHEFRKGTVTLIPPATGAASAQQM